MRLLFFTSVLLFLFSDTYSQKATLRGTIEQIHDEALYLLLYPGDSHGRYPLDTLMVEESFELLREPGAYTVVLEGMRHDRVMFPVLLSPDANETVKITLTPFGIEEEVDSVAIVGKFNDWKRKGSVALARRGTQWVLEDTSALRPDAPYEFLLNGKYRTYAPHLPTRIDGIKGQLQNYYDGAMVKLEIADLPIRQAASSVRWPTESVNAVYSALQDSLTVIKQERYTLIPRVFEGKAQKEDVTAYWNRFGPTYEKHAPRFPQIVAENQLIDLLYLHPAMMEAYRLDQQSAGDQTYDSLFRSVQFDDFMTRIRTTTQTLDPQSYLMEPHGISQLAKLDQYLARSAYLRNTYQQEEDYYHRYVLNYADSAIDEEKAATVLFTLSYEYLTKQPPDKGITVLKQLKARYPESYYVKEGLVDKQLAGMRTVAGVPAPAFAVKTLTGDSLRLTDLTGYVFLDFWGSWCRPCLDELPNLAALSKAFSTDQLQVVGLAEDREPKLRKYLEKHPLPYANALAPQAIEAYGITSFPTTFLISPAGMIIAKNLRGENLTELVKEKIASHEATVKTKEDTSEDIGDNE